MSIPGFHIPGTLVPIGAVVAQGQDETEVLLLLLAGDQGDAVVGDPEGSPLVEYAVLEFSRVKHNARTVYTLTWDGHTDGPFEFADKMKKLHEAETEVAVLNQGRKAEVEEQRKIWLQEHATVRENLSEQVPVSAFRKETRKFDELEIDGVVSKTAAGNGAVLLNAEAERRFPFPKDLTVKVGEGIRPEVRTWQARWTTDAHDESIPVPENLWWNTIPTGWVISQLNTRASEGWRLLHVGVDEGLYEGRDTRLAAGPASVRYLLGR